MKMYITFGQSHVHNLNGECYDKDCIAVIHGINETDCQKAVKFYFGQKYCFSFNEEDFKKQMDADSMEWYKRGLIEVNKPNAH